MLETKTLKVGIDPRLLIRKRPIHDVNFSKEYMFITILVLTKTPTPPTNLLSHVPKNSLSPLQSQQAVIVGIDANAKIGPEQQSDVLGKWFYPMEQTSDNGNRLIHLCEQTNLIIASTFKGNHRRHQLTLQETTILTPEEQRKRKMPTLKLQLDYDLTKNIPLSNIRKSRVV
ncbi:hypothetical protein RB195_023786 [Necator americanus]|uniref:Uncharacterized protein n=1 Tax=Necator americanus TaxID=51031 RepID=A0ABR1EL21_NECAM